MNKVVEPVAIATLKEVQHTRGPWAVGPYRGGSVPGRLRGTLIVSKALPSGFEPHVGIALDEGAVLQLGVVLASPHPGINAQTSKANAALIAAAPELLAACSALVLACDQHPPMDLMNEIARVCETARAAILKATSSSSPKGGS